MVINIFFECVFVPGNERPLLFEPPAALQVVSELTAFLAQDEVELASEHVLDGLSGSGIVPMATWIP